MRAIQRFCRLIVGILLFGSVTGSAQAAGGIVITDVSGRAYAMVIDNLGRIVTGGSPRWGDGFALTRFNSDGTLDTAYGSGGVVIADASGIGRGLTARAMAMDSVGRIIVVGTSLPRGTYAYIYADSNNDFYLTRYNSDGTLDSGFGNGGFVTTDVSAFGSNDWANGVAIDSVGRIVVVGSTFTSRAMSYPSMVLARYDSDGFLDPTFGDGGIVITDISGRGLFLAVAIDAVGRIVVAGRSNGAFMLARYNPDGWLDNSFGGNSGIVVVPNIGGSGGYEWAATVAIDSLGRIVAAGEAATYVGSFGRLSSFALVRCNADGALDTAFGNGGMVTTHISGEGIARYDSATGIIIDNFGRIVAVGGCPFDCGAFDFELARYNPDGTRDKTFGNGGLVTTHLGTTFSNNSSQAVAIDNLGRIIVAGSSDDDAALARYDAEGSLDSTFGGAMDP